MKQFFKYLLATIVGILISSIVLFFLFIGSLMSLSSGLSEDKQVEIKDSTILKITLSEPIFDRSPQKLDIDFSTMQPKKSTGLNTILKSIKKASTDTQIKGIYLNITDVKAGFATVEEIRNALLKFKESGKPIYSYSEIYTHKAYYLASVADSIFLNPTGDMIFQGLSSGVLFFKNALDKYGVDAQIVRCGTFKSAVEPFMYDKMSEANRTQIRTYLGSMWSHMLANIAQSRGKSVSELQTIADSLMVRSPEKAIELGLIDGTIYKDELLSKLQHLSGAKSTDKIPVTTIADYAKTPDLSADKTYTTDRVAVIYAIGSIESGNGDDQTIGSERISKAIREARLDKNVKAIVLRVNSPGGSALASDVIWREVVLAKKEKPVIASMGDVAASGGYYISCAADTIVASPNTITGSIGVFGILWNGEKLMENIGITVDTVKTASHADIGSMYRGMSTAEYAIIQSMVDKVYATFKQRVADGRGMTVEEVDAVGQGRVWSGANAKEKGLVDVFGGLNTAIEIAVNKAGLENYRVIDYPKQKSPIEAILESLGHKVSMSFIETELGDSYKYFNYISYVKSLENKSIQAQIPYMIEIN